jgi:hypothetical protein
VTRAFARGRGRLLLGVLLPSTLLAACDGILGIPSDITEGDPDASGDAQLADVTIRADAADGEALDGTVADGSPPMDASGDSAPADSGPADADAGCDPLSQFGTAVAITELNPGVPQGSIRLNDDETVAFFTRAPNNQSTYDLYTATRANGVFGTPVPIPGAVNTADNEYSPNLSADMLSLIFERQISSVSHLYYASRATPTAAFSAGVYLQGISMSSSYTAQPFARGDLSTVTYVQATNQNTIEIDLATSPDGPAGTFASSTLLPSAATFTLGKGAPALSADGQWLYYSDDAPQGEPANLDMYVVSIHGGTPTPLRSLNTLQTESVGWISADSCRLYFDQDYAGDTTGMHGFYVASRTKP